MKKKREVWFPIGDEMRLHIRKMKLTAILLFIVCITFGNSFSQVRLLVRFNQTDIREALKTIEDKTDYIFLYKDEIFDFSKKVSGDFNDSKFEDVLNSFCDQTNTTFEIRERQIILKEKVIGYLLVEQQPQKKTVSGKVNDSSGGPLPGVSVVVIGTTVGTITDMNGNFSLLVPIDATKLTFSFIGMKSQVVPITGKSEFNVVLEEETVGLDEVVAIGYGTQKRESLTAAVSTISAQEIVQSPTANLTTGLAGKLPGLTVMLREGEPGREDIETYIRGQASLNNTAPLILVDGVERELGTLNSYDIESISVLKDASATAVYGVRGANGVILVITRKGFIGKPKVTANINYSLQGITRIPKAMNAIDYMKTRNQVIQQNNEAMGQSDPLPYSEEIFKVYETGLLPEYYVDRDWYNEFTYKYVPMTKTSVNISGGDEKTKYFVSMGYLDQGGPFKTERWERYNYDNEQRVNRYTYRANVDMKINKRLKLWLNLSGHLQEKNDPYIYFRTQGQLEGHNLPPLLKCC